MVRRAPRWPAILTLGAGLVLAGSGAWGGAPAPPKLEGATEFQLNTSTDGNQLAPDSARLPGGGAVVVWDTALGTGGLRGRILDPDGDPIGADFVVPSTDSSVAFLAQATVGAGDPSGSFVVTWRRKLVGENEPDVTGRRFLSSGLPVGQDFVVPESSEGYQGSPRVGMSPTGGFLVLWTGFDTNLWGRAFDSTGAPLSDDVVVRGGTETFNIRHDLAALPDGRFVVTWTSYDFNASKSRVDARPVSAAGELLGAPIEVSDPNEIADTSAVAVDPTDGSVLVVWHQSNFGRAIPVSIFGRRLSSDGALVGGAFEISDPGITSWYPDVTDGGLPGEFVVAWETGDRFDAVAQPGTDGSGLAVNGRIVRDGLSVGSSIQINEYTAGSQLDVSIARLRSRSFLASWVSQTGPGDDGSGTMIEARSLTRWEEVFADDFESGGPGAWSTSWP